MIRLEFHPEARAEYVGAVAYYEERRAGLGTLFANEVEAALRRIQESPATWRIIEADVRRCLTRKFPFGVLYTIESDYVSVLAVMHCSREPGYWRSRQAGSAD